jgi:hypothetical protein
VDVFSAESALAAEQIVNLFRFGLVASIQKQGEKVEH